MNGIKYDYGTYDYNTKEREREMDNSIKMRPRDHCWLGTEDGVGLMVTRLSHWTPLQGASIRPSGYQTEAQIKADRIRGR